MLIFQSADLKTSFSADLPLTYRRRTADLPLTYPPPYRGSSLGKLPHGGISPDAIWSSVGSPQRGRIMRLCGSEGVGG